MVNFTSNTYQLKREILNFSYKISSKLSKRERKFIADMNYGILACKSCLLTDIVNQLHEPSKKINSVDRLSKHLSKGIPKAALIAYLHQVKRLCPKEPVIHIDDSDVVNPDGYKFEALGRVLNYAQPAVQGANRLFALGAAIRKKNKSFDAIKESRLEKEKPVIEGFLS